MPISIGAQDLQQGLVVFDITPDFDYNDPTRHIPTINIVTIIGDRYDLHKTEHVIWQGTPEDIKEEAYYTAFEHLTNKLKNILS